MPSPLVSVLLPVFNGEPYLGAALASILRQDYGKLELIAIDDGSTDGSLQTLERFRETDDRMVLVSRENRGLVATLNEGLAIARGDLVARMDADDIAYPERLSRQVAAFSERPGLALCGTGIDTLIGRRLVRGTPDPILQRCDLGILSQFFTIFIHSTVVFSRRVIPSGVLAYDPRYQHAEDFDLFRRIAASFPAIMLGENLVAYRSHEESVTNRHKSQMRRTHLSIVAENLDRAGLVHGAGDLCDVGRVVTAETVRRAADALLRLEAAIAGQPEKRRASYEAGALNLFYFLYQLIGDACRPQLTHEFLTRTGRWGSIRRRERCALLAGARAPWLSRASIAANRRIDGVTRYLKSRPASPMTYSH